MSDTTLKSINDMTFIQKVNFIQCNLNAPKNMYNSFGKYNYRNLEGIFEGLKPLSLVTGLVTTVSDEMVMIGDRIYVKATATITDGDNSLSVTRYAREDAVKKGMDLSQLTGSCSSYAGKYACNGLFLIDDTVDADGMDNSNSSKPQSKSKPNPTQTSSGDSW